MQDVFVVGSACTPFGKRPEDSFKTLTALAYEAVLKSNGFLVMAHGTPEEMARAKAIMQVGNARKIDMHEGGAKPLPVILG